MTSSGLAPLDWRVPIVDSSGRPGPEFQLKWGSIVSKTGDTMTGALKVNAGVPGVPSNPSISVTASVLAKSTVVGAGYSVLDAGGGAGVSGFYSAWNATNVRIGYTGFYDGANFIGAMTDSTVPLMLGFNSSFVIELGEAKVWLTNPTHRSANAHLEIGRVGGVAGTSGYNAIGVHADDNTTNFFVMYITNTSGTIGSIVGTPTAVFFNTTSDETYKDFIGPYSATTASDIIRSDHVREFTWKSNGSYAVGWGAQTSYEISPDLASPGGWRNASGPCEETDEGAQYYAWGVDQAKRTPYLWAAIGAEGGILDRLDELEQKVQELTARLDALV